MLWLPLDNGETKRRGSLFVTPAAGSPLQPALSSLEGQFGRNWRSSLIQGTVQTDEWEVLRDCSEYNNNCKDDPMAQNTSPIIMEIKGDRINNRTELKITKNGVDSSIVINSTWGLGLDVFVYFGIDSMEQEKFTLSRIHQNDICSWTPAPTNHLTQNG